MNKTSRTITGMFLIFVGIGLLIPLFFGFWITVIFSILLLILGFYILFNKDEDIIEERKDKRRANKNG
ncbi:hypothetical protein LDC_0041 [sediment metagenome]|uniref:Uncharacterized protein n=1 Tax=sediment metagenome TaxID=749907 RepID=D9PEW3_9ZZZZ